MKFEQIKEKLKNGSQYFLYNLKPEKPYLLVQGKTKSELKKLLKEKVIKNPDKYRDTLCILMYFEFRVPTKITPGELIVRVHRYKITEKLGLRGEPKPFGYVYFKKTYLERKGFSYTYLRNIMYLYKLRKITFFALGQPGYNELEGEIEDALLHYKKIDKKKTK
jgi:hypothetical protein